MWIGRRSSMARPVTIRPAAASGSTLRALAALGVGLVMRDEPEQLAVEAKDAGRQRAPHSRAALSAIGSKHRLDVRRRAADDAQDLGCRRLLLERLGEVAVARLELL